MPCGLPVALSADLDAVQVDAGEPHGDARAAEVCAFIVDIFPVVLEMIGSAEVARAGCALVLSVVLMFGEHMSKQVVAPVVARVALCAGMWPLERMFGPYVSGEMPSFVVTLCAGRISRVALHKMGNVPVRMEVHHPRTRAYMRRLRNCPSCVICFERGPLARPGGCRCEALYHLPCLLRWCDEEPTCPQCRRPFEFVVDGEGGHVWLAVD